jgi:HEAT repeat protein
VSTLAQLARRLDSSDVNESGLALGELVAQGTAATPVLTQAARSESADVRKLAMEGLGTIADPASLDDVRRGLDDPDGRVRSLAAVALNRLGAPDALDALLATLDDWPDLTRSDMSKSAYELAGSGPRALPIAIPLLADEKWTTRAKGVWIIRRIVSRNRDDPALAELEAIVSGFDARDEHEQERERAAADARAWLERRTGG